MRWKIQLRYLGTAYCGWQRQPDERSVQQVLEESLGTILRQEIEVTGCGRTDAGVHARMYVAHFDAEPIADVAKTIYQLNAILPHDVAIEKLETVISTFHARYDAIVRGYKYYIHFEKDPFRQDQSYYFQQHRDLNTERMQAAANLLLDFEQFKPFCKTGSDADHFICYLKESRWDIGAHEAVYTVQANRFLRGMVRLIVGATLNAGLGKISLTTLKSCLDTQSVLPQAWSVPAHGLFLEKVEYPQ
jgi:tRNA pseudouridine38-40 synthase